MPMQQNIDGSASDSQPLPNIAGQPEVIQEEEYSEDQEFEEEPVHSAKSRPLVALAEIQSVLSDFTVYLQVKQIPHTHILRYLLPK